jgi:hypothetical protein
MLLLGIRTVRIVTPIVRNDASGIIGLTNQTTVEKKTNLQIFLDRETQLKTRRFQTSILKLSVISMTLAVF